MAIGEIQGGVAMPILKPRRSRRVEPLKDSDYDHEINLLDHSSPIPQKQTPDEGALRTSVAGPSDEADLPSPRPQPAARHRTNSGGIEEGGTHTHDNGHTEELGPPALEVERELHVIITNLGRVSNQRPRANPHIGGRAKKHLEKKKQASPQDSPISDRHPLRESERRVSLRHTAVFLKSSGESRPAPMDELCPQTESDRYQNSPSARPKLGMGLAGMEDKP